MTEHEAFENLTRINIDTTDVAIYLASIPKGHDTPVLVALNVSADLAEQFRHTVKRVVGRLKRDMDQGDLLLQPYEAGYRPDSHELEWIKVEGIQEIEESIKGIPDSPANVEMFSEQPNFIEGLRFYVIDIVEDGRHARFFRKYDQKKELGRSRFFAAMFSGGQFDRITQQTFLFDEEIDCIEFAGTIFSLRKHDFQMIFRFFEKITQKATASLVAIGLRVPIANFREFSTSCLSHLSKMVKLNNIAQKDYLQTVTMDALKGAISHLNLNIRVVEEGGIEKLAFDSADKWILLKLLDDDYLQSGMTTINYSVNSKRIMT